MAGQTYGYMRVSARDQNEERQKHALIEFGVPEDHLFLDKQSGKDFNRPGYQKVMQMLEPEDVLVIKSIDRLGRNYDEILEQWRVITKDKKAFIVVLDMPLLDTRVGKDLTGTFIADLVLQLLSYVAETERRFIRQRQAEGIAAAKARGVKFGRPGLEMKPEVYELAKTWRRGEISTRKAAEMLNVSHQTFRKWVSLIETETEEKSTDPDHAFPQND